jgi:hypothetical protein
MHSARWSSNRDAIKPDGFSASECVFRTYETLRWVTNLRFRLHLFVWVEGSTRKVYEVASLATEPVVNTRARWLIKELLNWPPNEPETHDQRS